MKKIIFFAAFSLLAQAPYRSLTGGYGDASLPNTATFNNLTALRIEFRYSPSGTSGRIVGFPNFLINQGSGVISFTSFIGGGEAVTVNYSGATDLIVRVQQDATYSWIDAWSADGTTYYAGQKATQSLGTLDLRNGDIDIRHNGGGGGGTAGNIAWIRAYSTASGTGLIRDDSVPSNAASGTPLVVWELEASGADTGPNSAPLTMTSATYASTPVVAQVGEPITVRTGTAATLNCSGTNADTYKWRYIGTSRAVTIAAPTSGSTTATGLNTFGQYDFRCEATINGVSSTSNFPVGAVATNASGVIVPPTDRIGFITAPMLRNGASPWPYYDKNRPRRARAIAAPLLAAMAADINTPLTGTVSINNGSVTLTGSGTTFTSQYANNAQIVIYYDQGSGVIGRHRAVVSTVNSDTSITLSANWAFSNQSGVQHQRWGTGDGGDANQAWVDSLNYYDVVLANYITYYKTGLTEFATTADTAALYWWLYLDRGAYYAAPRLMAYEGVAIAAERGVIDLTDFHADVQLYNYDAGSGVSPGYRNYITERNTDEAYQNFYFGARESGYSWRYGLISGVLHPTGSVKAAWLGRFSTNIQNHYRDFQCKSSNPANAGRCRTPEGAFRWGDDFRGGGFVGKYAEEPWHTGIAMQGIIRYHRQTGNSTAQTVITEWVNGLLNNSQSGGPSGTSGMYMLTTASDFAGINCRRHYYTSDGGTETALTSGLMQGGGCAGGADAVYGGRDTNNEIISSYGYAYRLTGTAAIKTRGDEVFAATYGADDGYHGQWAWTGATNLYKVHGQALCCNDSYLVDRLGSTDADITPVSASVNVGFSLAGVPSAAKIRVTITTPKGTTATATCTSSPCSVTGLDSRQGTAGLMLVEYLSAGDVVLAAGEARPVTI